MKKIFFALMFGLVFSLAQSQTTEHKLYDPAANAEKDITAAVKLAKESNKHVLIQAGGNWCKWCIEFNRFSKADKQIDSLLQADYIVYHLNYSKENTNEKIFAELGYPERFGFPVFIILDANGKRIHTQNSAYLEDGKSYNKTKVMEFLTQWNLAAVSPKTNQVKK